MSIVESSGIPDNEQESEEQCNKTRPSKFVYQNYFFLKGNSNLPDLNKKRKHVEESNASSEPKLPKLNQHCMVANGSDFADVSIDLITEFANLTFNQNGTFADYGYYQFTDEREFYVGSLEMLTKKAFGIFTIIM